MEKESEWKGSKKKNQVKLRCGRDRYSAGEEAVVMQRRQVSLDEKEQVVT